MTTTEEVPMPEPPKPTYVHRLLGEMWDRFDLQRHAIDYADARCAKLQSKLAISELLEESAREGAAFAHKFNEAMGNEMRAAGCVLDIEAMNVRNVRAEKAEAERDSLAERVKALEADARRYRWLRDRANFGEAFHALAHVSEGKFDERVDQAMQESAAIGGGET